MSADDEFVGLEGQVPGLVVGLQNLKGKGIGSFRFARFDGDVVVEIESQAEGIEAGPEVGGGGGNTDPERKAQVGGLHRSRKNFSAASVVARAVSSKVRPRRAASFSATRRVWAGSQRLPRSGSGAR